MRRWSRRGEWSAGEVCLLQSVYGQCGTSSRAEDLRLEGEVAGFKHVLMAAYALRRRKECGSGI